MPEQNNHYGRDFPDPFDQHFPVNSLPPVNRDRIKKILESHGWGYQVSTQGDIAGAWQNGIYHFQVTGKDDTVMCVRGTWRGRLDLDDFLLATSLCNQWNTDSYWPKTYARATDDRELFIHTELPLSYQNGVTDSQLDEQINCALQSSEEFFAQLRERFPQALTQSPDKD